MRKLLCLVLLVMVAVALPIPAMATNSNGWDVTQLGGFWQLRFAARGNQEDLGKHFYIRRLRPSITLTNRRWRFYCQLQLDRASKPCQAYVDFRIVADSTKVDSLTFRFGQVDNPYKFMEPGPSKQRFVYYGLVDHYVTNQYDLGIGGTARIGHFFGELYVLNGAGVNEPDNNDSYDVVAYGIFQHQPNLSYEASVTVGTEPDGNRQAIFLRTNWAPFARYAMTGGVTYRSDYRSRGWYWASYYDLRPNVCLTARLTQRTQNEYLIPMANKLAANRRVELVLGAALTDGPIRWQPNIIFGAAKPELAMIVQATF